MKNKILAIMLVCVSCVLIHPALAQSDSKPADIVSLNDQIGHYPLGLHLEILEDPSGHLTIEQVSSPEFDSHFTLSNEATLRFGVTRSAIWTRLRLEDLSQNVPHWLLEVNNATLEYVDLYLPQSDGSYQYHPSGLLVPDAVQEFPDNHYVFEIPRDLQANQPIYLRFASSNSMNIPATLWSLSAYDLMERNEELLWGAFYGILLVMAIYNSLLFLSLRDRNYLFLVLYILTVLLQTAFFDGRVKDLLPADLGYQYHYLEPIFAIPNLPALLLFSTSFLNVKEFAPRLYKVVLWLFVLLALLILSTFVVNRYLITILFLLVSLPVVVIVVLSGFVAWKKGFRPARYFLIAMLVPLLFGFSISLGWLGLLPVIPSLYQLSHFGDAILVTILSLALADRINYYKHQTEEALEDVSQREKVITEYKELYQSLVEKEALLICRFSSDGSLTFVNRAYCDYFGKTREDLLHSNIFEIVYESERDIVKSALAKIVPNNPTVLIEFQAINRDGEDRWLRSTNQGFFDDQENLIEYQSTGEDITERVALDEQLARYRENLEELVVERTHQERHQRAIAESLQLSASVLNSDLNLDNVLSKILEQLPQVIELDSASIYLKDGQDLVLSNASDDSQAEPGQKFPLLIDRVPAVKVFLEGKSLLFSDMQTDPNCDDWENSACIRSWMGTPLQSGDEVIGVLSASSASPDLYDNTKLPVLEAFANHAAIAIVNARLYEESRIVAALEERNRLARDLHDSVTQTLFSASLIAQALPLQWDQNETAARANLKRLYMLTSGALAEMRMLLLELRPGSLTQIPLAELLKNLCEAYQAKYNVPVKMELMEDGAAVLPVEVKETLYRLTQEALNNISKHSQAAHVAVRLDQTEAGIHLCIQDDGKGFDPNDTQPGHLGLQIMHERVAAINANLLIESCPGKGTTINAEWKNSE